MESNMYKEDLLKFLDTEIDPHNRVYSMKERLKCKGYKEKSLGDLIDVEADVSKTVFTYHGMIGAIHSKCARFTRDTRIILIVAHSDSPALRTLNSKEYSSGNFKMVNVMKYGGGLWYSWLDRPLYGSGRVAIRHKNKSSGEKITWAKFRTKSSICYLPSLAPHITTLDERQKIMQKPKLEPLLSIQLDSELLEREIKSSVSAQDSDEIINCELWLGDSQSPQLCGVNGEFISAQGLDNLLGCYCGIRVMEELEDFNPNNCVIFLGLNYEEIGSHQNSGADSSLVTNILSELFKTKNADHYQNKILSQSFCFSIDGAHATHPSYQDMANPNYKIKIDTGIVLKVHNQSYSTTFEGMTIIKEACHRSGVECEEFTVLPNQPCGGTVGPMIAERTTINTVDIGTPILGMHSIRECCHINSPELMIKALKTAISEFEDIICT